MKIINKYKKRMTQITNIPIPFLLIIKDQNISKLPKYATSMISLTINGYNRF